MDYNSHHFGIKFSFQVKELKLGLTFFSPVNTTTTNGTLYLCFLLVDCCRGSTVYRKCLLCGVIFDNPITYKSKNCVQDRCNYESEILKKAVVDIQCSKLTYRKAFNK